MFGLGVADGVYMWRDQGIDAGALARKLTSTSQSAVDSGVVDVLAGEGPWNAISKDMDASLCDVQACGSPWVTQQTALCQCLRTWLSVCQQGVFRQCWPLLA